MKKLFLIMVLSALNANTYAENDNIKLLNENRHNSINIDDPIFTFSAMDASNTTMRRLPNNHIFTRDKLTDRFCWEVRNLPANKRLYNVDLTLTAPSPTTFINSEGQRTYSSTYTSHLQLEAKEGRIGDCGMFEAGDPTGTYVLQITVEGKAYPEQAIILR